MRLVAVPDSSTKYGFEQTSNFVLLSDVNLSVGTAAVLAVFEKRKSAICPSKP